MTLHPTDDALHDWADGTLEPSMRPGLERHLAQCGACRTEVERLRRLLALAADAPRSAEPEEDLWPAIVTRITPGSPRPLASAGARRSPADAGARTRRVLQLLAAGLAIATASSALTLWLADAGQDRAPAVAGAAGSQDTASPGDPAAAPTVADQYARVADELATAWRRTQALDPASAAALDAELRAIDLAIAESRRALEAAPDDPLLAEILTAAFRRKVELLRRALELPTWT